MNLYFDTEFTGLHKNTTLISIGIVSEDGKTFYAECNDYGETQCDDWIKENVTSELLHLKPEIWESGVADRQILGTRKEVAYALKDWLQQFREVQFVSDVCHYDFVLLIDLFGTAFDLPDNVSPVCHDINVDIARYYDISEEEAFNKSREEIVENLWDEPRQGRKHNALYDAECIKVIYRGIFGAPCSDC